MTVRAPRTLEQAAKLMTRFAELDERVVVIRRQSNGQIAEIMAAADAAVAPMVEEIDKLRPVIERWWREHGTLHLPKGRKSMLLAGCSIGLVAGRAKLAHDYDDDDAAVEALRAGRLMKGTIRTKLSLDKVAIAKLLDQSNAKARKLGDLGFRLDRDEQFVLARAEQAGTLDA